SGFRVFGHRKGELPGKVKGLTAVRDPRDPRQVSLSWDKPGNTSGYVISYGPDSARLYLNYMVYGDTSLTIHSLNSRLPYYFTIEAFNDKGITQSGLLIPAPVAAP
ncbi:MAG TPA: fibronectin type III domain-containing protein, partial [Prolixibacteraceae bacterium]|nr:fibronectin type III domain-containing protein [Prolixibacteraceae bacterium]